MTPKEAISFFGSQKALASALSMAQPSISEWVSEGSIPWTRQFQIQAVTNGALMADPTDPRKKRASLQAA